MKADIDLSMPDAFRAHCERIRSMYPPPFAHRILHIFWEEYDSKLSEENKVYLSAILDESIAH